MLLQARQGELELVLVYISGERVRRLSNTPVGYRQIGMDARRRNDLRVLGTACGAHLRSSAICESLPPRQRYH